MKRDRAYQLRNLIVKASASLPDEDALSAVELFKPWVADTAYSVDERIRYGGKLYRCVQGHTSQADWTPDTTPALWTEVALEGVIPVWRQPTGAQDAYAKGDKVHFPTVEDAVYISTVDSNVWQPGVYGWEMIE